MRPRPRPQRSGSRTRFVCNLSRMKTQNPRTSSSTRTNGTKQAYPRSTDRLPRRRGVHGFTRVRTKQTQWTKTEGEAPTEERKDGRTKERKNGKTERRKDGRTEGRKDGKTEENNIFTAKTPSLPGLKLFLGVLGVLAVHYLVELKWWGPGPTVTPLWPGRKTVAVLLGGMMTSSVSVPPSRRHWLLTRP